MDRGQSIQVLDRVVSWLTDNKEDAHKLFLECTASGRAYLPSSGLGEFVRRVEPEAGDADRRLVVANIVRRIQVRLSKLSYRVGNCITSVHQYMGTCRLYTSDIH